jgi:hypothetical protein
MNSFTIQRAGAWSAIAAIFLFFLGFVLAGFIPPPPPSWTADQVANHYKTYATGIRIGMLGMMVSGMFVSPLVAVISAQLNRIPGLAPGVSYAQLSAGTIGIAFFMVPAVFFLITAYRPDRPAEVTYYLNDASWIMSVLPWPPAFIQNMIIAIAVFSDRSAQPIFPRWYAYVNIWVALGFLPASVLVFVTSGPFAWNGIFSFWEPGSVFIVWFVVTTYVLLKAIGAEEHASLSHLH